jgi:hypothetical protein
MRTTPPDKLEAARVRDGDCGSDESYGMNGKFRLIGPNGAEMIIVSSDGYDPIVRGWEHVSVSLTNRAPNWREMSFVKDLFWDENETVVQFHPRSDQYVNYHPHCLHLWKNCKFEFVLPPTLLVGPK